MKHITIFDIAKKLGISPSTVSRALNDHPNISQQTKFRVKKMAEELDFSPNSIAKSLKNNSTTTIGVIVPDIKHDFFSSAISGIEEFGYNAGYSIIVCQSNDCLEREIINTNVLLHQRIAGVIVSISLYTNQGDHFKKIINRGIPLVFFDRACDDVAACKVIIDDLNSAFNAVNYLINKGHKKIAHLAGPQTLNIYKKRLEGYKNALLNSGLPFLEDYVLFGDVHEKDGYKALDCLFKKRLIPDAVFTINDDVAIGALQRIKEEGFSIPEDIALIGFSNTKISSVVHPSITTINQPSFDMGKKATEILIELIEKRNRIFDPKTIVLNTELVIRESA